MEYLQGKLPNLDIAKPLSTRIEEAGDEDKVILEVAIADGLTEKSFGSYGIELLGPTKTVVVTVAGASGTLSLTIAGTAYAQAFDTSIETTIDNWLTTHAATVLAAHEITATKSAADKITLVGTVWAGAYTYADSSATMTASGDGGTLTYPTHVGPFYAVLGVDSMTLDSTGTVLGGSNANADTKLWNNFAVANGDKLLMPFTSVKLSAGLGVAYYAE